MQETEILTSRKTLLHHIESFCDIQEGGKGRMRNLGWMGVFSEGYSFTIHI